ncbi:Hemerythrin HHE cation binding domain-containing protein [Mesobacillus persicus]|uniref:Hemerythrin HHE cation binding domain-containing protein n=1 Tax=Mesobacillus persicus TaxID=930146 RepID=A0A1H8DCW1_9BACI|nr:hemerythrin domain-containing protein [Mesobacillus persicus]SEN05113.1 Hemerythrin HHE cation binding domain-containing protein [Mesobacillus persicus]
MEELNLVLCAPLQQLKDEHVSLRAEMNLFYEIAEEIECESGPAVVLLFAELFARVSAFTEELKAHSKREEDGLFPLMVRRLEKNDHTIAEMEEEHEKAEQHLQDFLTEANQAGTNIDEHDAQFITVSAVQAYATLTQHFAKEEKVLFPLAEAILSLDDKTELKQLLQTSDRQSRKSQIS